jgi:hypothetical protein
MATVSAFVRLAGDGPELADGFGAAPDGRLVRPFIVDLPDAPGPVSGRVELRLTDAEGATLLLHGSYPGEGDELRRAVHGWAFRHLTRIAAELDPEQARRRARANHPSMLGRRELQPAGARR